MKRVVAGLFILSGISFVLFGIYLVYLRHSPKLLTFENAPTSTVAVGKVVPSAISIPSLKITLPIIPAIANRHDWETTHNGVSYLSGSPLPGTAGNSVFYGHNWESLLSELPNIKTGELITIKLNNGAEQSFRVEYTAVVNPDQTYVIKNTQDSRITLYTCTGFLDSKRFVVVAKPII